MLKIVLLSLVGFFTISANAQNTVYSLKDCIELAISQNIQVKQARVALVQAESQAKTEKLSFLPTANATASHTYNLGRSIDRFSNEFVNSTVRNNYFSLNTNLTLYNGLQKQNNLKARNYNQEAAEKGLAATQNQIAMQVSEIFLQYMLNKENLTIATNQQAQTESQLERVNKLFEAGSVDQGQVLNLKAQKANDVISIITAQNGLQNAKMNLRLMLFISPEESFDLKFNDTLSVGAMETADVDLIYENALNNMPQIAQAEAQLNSSEMSYKTSLGARAPNISAYANLSTVYSGNAKEVTSSSVVGTRPVGVVDATGQVVSTPSFDFQTQTIAFGQQLGNNFGQSVGFQMSVPIFNGNQINNSILNSRTNYELNKLNVQNIKQQVKNDVSLAVNNANLALQKYLAVQESVKAQELSQSFAEKRFTAGLLNYYDYNDARNLYITSLNNLQSAKYEYIFKKMIVEFYKDNTWKF